MTGTIVFAGGGKESSPSPIGPDGGYRVENPPPGEVDILIKGFPGMGGPVATPRNSAAMPPDLSRTASTRKGVAPPLKYARAGAIRKLKVTGGRQKHDIALTP